MSNTVNKVLSKTPVYTGMQVLRIINSLVQSNLIGKGEKEYMTDLVSKGMKVETMRIQHHPEKGAQNRALENRAFQNKKDAV